MLLQFRRGFPMFFRRRQKSSPSATAFKDFLETVEFVDALVRQEEGASRGIDPMPRQAAETLRRDPHLNVAIAAK
jgi:hypothetical protein